MEALEDREIERWQIGQEVYEKVMEEFETGRLKAVGKGEITYTVTNPKQAYAIAMAMSARAEKRYSQQHKPQVQ